MIVLMRDKYSLHDINEGQIFISLMRWKYGKPLREFVYIYRYRETNILDMNISC
jgi:hypothetical protein